MPVEKSKVGSRKWPWTALLTKSTIFSRLFLHLVIELTQWRTHSSDLLLQLYLPWRSQSWHFKLAISFSSSCLDFFRWSPCKVTSFKLSFNVLISLSKEAIFLWSAVVDRFCSSAAFYVCSNILLLGNKVRRLLILSRWV